MIFWSLTGGSFRSNIQLFTMDVLVLLSYIIARAGRNNPSGLVKPQWVEAKEPQLF